MRARARSAYRWGLATPVADPASLRDLMAHILSNTINYLVPLLPIVMIVIFTDFTRLAFVISGFLDPFSYSSPEGNGCNFESFWTQGILNPSWPPPPRFVLIFSRYCSVFSFLFFWLGFLVSFAFYWVASVWFPTVITLQDLFCLLLGFCFVCCYFYYNRHEIIIENK